MNKIRMTVGLVAMILVAASCEDVARYTISGADAPTTNINGVTVGDVTITKDGNCGANKITKITGAGTVAYAQYKTANYVVRIDRNASCNYFGGIELGFPAEDGSPECLFGINGGLSPVFQDSKHGVTGVSGQGIDFPPNSNCPASVVLDTYTLLDAQYTP